MPSLTCCEYTRFVFLFARIVFCFGFRCVDILSSGVSGKQTCTMSLCELGFVSSLPRREEERGWCSDFCGL